MVEVHFRQMQPTEEDLALLKSALERNGSARDPELLRWRYLKNPNGKAYGELALHDGAYAAAICAVVPAKMRLAGRPVLGAQSLDTVTDVEFRRRGHFVTMAQTVLARCQREGLVCVYGFPNGSSAPGLFRRLDWAPLDPVPFLLKPLRANFFLRRLGVLAPLSELLPAIPLTLARRAMGLTRFRGRC